MHDSTVLSLSGIVEKLGQDPDFSGKYIYGDPAYGCSDRLCSPFPQSLPGSREALLNLQ